MRPSAVVVLSKLTNNASQMAFIDWDQVIQTLAANRTYDTLAVGIRHRTSNGSPAIWLRVELPVQSINTRFLLPITCPLFDGMRNDHGSGIFRQRWHQPAKQHGCHAVPASCATIKPGASAGRIPAKVSLADRTSVTAGWLAGDLPFCSPAKSISAAYCMPCVGRRAFAISR